ncbi:hypothetical protein [Lactococcus lactis]|uniref:hypothetical protein n=1 Tax=Lactococcus lactis TaxID=1358 RepID=UPI003D2B5FF9
MTHIPIKTDVEEEKENKKKKKRFLWFWLSLILLVGIAGGSYLYFNHGSSTPESQLVAGDFLPKKKDARQMTDAELAQYAQKAVDASQFQLMINPKSTINFDTQSGYIGIKNPKNNAYPINVNFYTSDNIKIYTSGAIEPGQEVTSGSLSTKLRKGTYEVKARFDIYDNKTKQKRGQQSAILEMTVQ